MEPYGSYSEAPTPSGSAGMMGMSEAASRGVSTDPEAGPSTLYGAGGFDAPTPGAASATDNDEPQELDFLHMDPINSGAVTPAVVEAAPAKRNKAYNFKKETKTIKGQVYTIVGDELILEDDPRGEAKVDPDGNLLGGRQYKLHTFTSPMRANPNKLYMLSIDAARAAGFRDSLYFFRRNPLIHKLSCTQAEKDRLIDLGKLSGNLKSRAVTMVSARNCYKVMGAAFVLNGKYVFDDYYEDKALAAGHQPGEPAWIETYDPEKDTGTLATAKGPAPPGATSSGLNQLLGHSGKPRPIQPDLRAGAQRDDFSSTVGGGMHAIFGGVGQVPFGKAWDPSAKKAKPAAHLTAENWMLEYAKNVRESNAQLGVVRKLNVGQVQIGVGIVEREEDMWIEVEEDDDEQPEPTPAPPMEEDRKPSVGPGMEMMDASGGLSALDGLASAAALFDRGSQPPQGSPALNPLLAAAYAAPSPTPAPLDYASPALSRAGSIAPLVPPPPRKRKLVKVYNPIRGIYDPETNVPHVYGSTQPTQCKIERVDLAPRIFDEGLEGENGFEIDEEERRKRRRLEEAAGRVGVASLMYVVDRSAAEPPREGLIPGMWDFKAGPGQLV
ncbi:chromatin remodelling complex Rsc7/Swp82 subunit-domain-containing protein [Leucosporidium creatinivorum]|uniref:Chromatin remodelling complex Rsc7/Swp82 subunit-domain-containing protein n=1 Tax=Leucosporidium creatinivorum TaxID=106004 RepID=A0A1Y2FTX6_9BASI|nr:chromatin remodelling complex Rsc7/Swp82 subunit-domain-containing protein [Leucosporidium creatinivorum]